LTLDKAGNRAHYDRALSDTKGRTLPASGQTKEAYRTPAAHTTGQDFGRHL